MSNTGFNDIINNHVLRDFHVSNDKNIISYYSYFQRNNGVQSILTNVIHADINSNNSKIQKKLMS